MMTKDQEREVLRQIIELIDSTEDGSYIKTAFYGCTQDAERNIDEDAAYSWHGRACAAERKAAEAQEAAKGYKEKAAYWEAEWKAAEAEHERQTEQAAAELRKAEGRQQEYKTMLDDANADFSEVQAEADALRQEVIELKAKLYDFMIKG